MTPAFSPWLYDLVMGAAEHTPLARWRRSVVGTARGNVLEIAAGTGLNFPYYSAHAVVVATDVDPRMLARARRRANDASDASDASILLVAADAEALPFRGGSFDAAVVGLALCTVPRPDAALTELRRVLWPGARLHLLEHVRVHGLVGRIQDWLTPVWRRVAAGCHLNRQTEAAVIANGFAIERMRSHAGGVFVSISARANQAAVAR